tara:strand:+ start:244 stop:855 length:612 start_codon:yes stop_codon:yes gene_type:complete
MKSLSEIETTSKRASRAIGFSWGIAEEVGKSARLLELFGLPGIKNLNQYFQNKKKKEFEKIKMIKEFNKPNKFSFCPIVLGINFLDQIRKIENLKSCSIQEIAYPLLLMPFLSRCSEIIGKKILFTFDENKFLFNFNVNINSNFFLDDFPSLAKNTEISFLDNKDSFSNLEWNNLYKLSEETFVKETESSKKEAAGAGLTDND